MAKKCEDEKCVHPNYSIEDEEDQEEALSLCDLPTNEDNHDQSRTEAAAAQAIQTQDDFDFGSWSSSSILTPPEMCAADDIFFQGQILPLRHSISSESGLAKFRQDSNKINRCISRSASMDHHCSGGDFSSRSSSIRSHNSASSGSTSTTTTLPPKGYYRPKLRNQFHSHPSPTPQLRIPSNRHNNSSHPAIPKSSTMWRFFQVGLLRTPEIELKNLKVRSRNNTIHPFGSRNSNSSISTSSSGCGIPNAENKKIENSKKMKLHSGLFGISCKCSVDAIETVPLNIVTIKNSSKGSEKEELLGKKKKKKKKEKEENQGKQAMSRHRTFEWLKQLSLQEDAASSSSRPDQV